MSYLGLPSPTTRPGSSYSYSGFRLPSSSSSIAGIDDANGNGNGNSNGDYDVNDDDEDDDADDDDAPLPFPTALSRRDFLAPDFDAAAYLSALHSAGPTARHQTLEDLRAELRERSAAISAELLELVNANYAAFLGLGDELRGGDERVEDVRVALLGFRRAVGEVQARVRERRLAVAALSAELGGVRTAVESGRQMLELDERVAGLEARLAVGSLGGSGAAAAARKSGGGPGWEEVDDDEEDEEEEEQDDEEDADEGAFVASSPGKLTGLAREYIIIERLADTLGRDLLFVKKMEERIIRCRNTIILDLNTALKEARAAGSKGQARVLKFLGIYRILDASIEAIRVLKS